MKPLERRLQERRSRVVVRSWHYRQRRHAHGAWFRLRRVLADASAAYAISPADAAVLIAEGARPEPVGAELEPSRIILFASSSRIAALPSARPIALTLGADLLAEQTLALTPFEIETAR
jgi:hypothetical protein